MQQGLQLGSEPKRLALGRVPGLLRHPRPGFGRVPGLLRPEPCRRHGLVKLTGRLPQSRHRPGMRVIDTGRVQAVRMAPGRGRRAVDVHPLLDFLVRALRPVLTIPCL